MDAPVNKLWPSPDEWERAEKAEKELKSLLRAWDDWSNGRPSETLELMSKIRQRWPDHYEQRETIRKMVKRLRELRNQA